MRHECVSRGVTALQSDKHSALPRVVCVSYPCVILSSLCNVCQCNMCCESLWAVNMSAPPSRRPIPAQSTTRQWNHPHYRRLLQPRYDMSCNGAQWKHDWLRLREELEGRKFSGPPPPPPPLFSWSRLPPLSRLSLPELRRAVKTTGVKSGRNLLRINSGGKLPVSVIMATFFPWQPLNAKLAEQTARSQSTRILSSERTRGNRCVLLHRYTHRKLTQPTMQLACFVTDLNN